MCVCDMTPGVVPVTPDDYEPPGFQPTSCQDFEFDSSAVNVRVGDVSTPFHSYVRVCVHVCV